MVALAGWSVYLTTVKRSPSHASICLTMNSATAAQFPTTSRQKLMTSLCRLWSAGERYDTGGVTWGTRGQLSATGTRGRYPRDGRKTAPQYFTINSQVVSVLAAGLRRRRAWGQIAAATLSGNSLRQTVHTHCASVHQAAKLVAALLRVAG